MTREKYLTRSILLGNQMCKDTAKALIDNCPLDTVKPLEFVLREQVKKRSKDSNALYWAGPINDFVVSAWYQGTQLSKDVWHFSLRYMFLPEEFKEGITLEGYRKWDHDPISDQRIMVGSTTQLTKRGFSEYLEQVYAYGAQLGVKFSSNREEY